MPTTITRFDRSYRQNRFDATPLAGPWSRLGGAGCHRHGRNPSRLDRGRHAEIIAAIQRALIEGIRIPDARSLTSASSNIPPAPSPAARPRPELLRHRNLDVHRPLHRRQAPALCGAAARTRRLRPRRAATSRSSFTTCHAKTGALRGKPADPATSSWFKVDVYARTRSHCDTGR